MYKWERTFSQWLLYLLAAFMLTACGSGDGDSVLPVNGISDYQLSVSSSATTIGASGSATVTATLLTPAGAPVAGANISFTRTGAGSLSANSGTTNAAGIVTITLNGTAAVTGSGTVTASFTDPDNNVAARSLTYTISSGDQVILFVDKSQVKSGVGDSVTVTAKVTDTNGAFVPNRIVTFTRIGTGDLQVVSAQTDANGTASATYTPGSIDFSNRTVDIVATTSSSGTSTTIEGRTTITVYGTRITLSSNLGTNITLGTTPSVTATLLDGNGNPIPNASLTFSSANNNTFTPAATGTTNAQGQVAANVAVNTAAGSNETITASSSALGASGNIAFAVTGTRFDFVAPSLNAELEINGARTITVRWLEGTTPQTGQLISFSSTRGTLSTTSQAIDGAGEASITINSTSAGQATIEAQTPTGLQISRTVEFVAATPSVITTQVARNVLAPGQQTSVTATLRDALNNPVKNKTVNFTLPADDSNGNLSAATAVSTSDGTATVIYTAGPNSGSTNGVTIRAATASPALSSDAQLTVGGEATFITLGTGNTIREVDSSTYGLPYTVLLTNSAGQPIANTSVTLSITPVKYFKGTYVLPLIGDFWIPVSTAQCINEDADLDGKLDANENDGSATAPDDNADGILWPGNVITVSSGTVTTNENGFANFEVRYPQQFGNWLEVELKASRIVSGTESVNTATFVPPISSDDGKVTQSPPGRSYSNPSAVGSPFGRGSDCLLVD